jgi:hypothetical protein
VTESAASTVDEPAEHAVEVRQPAVLVPVWWLLGLLVVAEAVHEIVGVGSPDALFGLGTEAFLLVAAAILCLARAGYEPRARRAWLWIGSGIASWAIGTVI